MSPGPAMGQTQGNGPDRGHANNDCRGDLESSRHPLNNPHGSPHNGRGNNDDRGREFDPFEIAGSPNNPHLIFGNNNGACVTLQN